MADVRGEFLTVLMLSKHHRAVPASELWECKRPSRTGSQASLRMAKWWRQKTVAYPATRGGHCELCSRLCCTHMTNLGVRFCSTRPLYHSSTVLELSSAS